MCLCGRSYHDCMSNWAMCHDLKNCKPILMAHLLMIQLQEIIFHAISRNTSRALLHSCRGGRCWWNRRRRRLTRQAVSRRAAEIGTSMAAHLRQRHYWAGPAASDHSSHQPPYRRRQPPPARLAGGPLRELNHPRHQVFHHRPSKISKRASCVNYDRYNRESVDNMRWDESSLEPKGARTNLRRAAACLTTVIDSSGYNMVRRFRWSGATDQDNGSARGFMHDGRLLDGQGAPWEFGRSNCEIGLWWNRHTHNQDAQPVTGREVIGEISSFKSESGATNSPVQSRGPTNMAPCIYSRPAELVPMIWLWIWRHA